MLSVAEGVPVGQTFPTGPINLQWGFARADFGGPIPNPANPAEPHPARSITSNPPNLGVKAGQSASSVLLATIWNGITASAIASLFSSRMMIFRWYLPSVSVSGRYVWLIR